MLSTSTSYQSTRTVPSLEQEFVHLHLPSLARALKQAGIFHFTAAAIFISQWFYWAAKPEVGHYLDGKLWIYNSYQDWIDQLETLSKDQFGRMIRQLCDLGIIEKSSFAHLKSHFKKPPPVSWHEWNRTSWIHIHPDTIDDLLGHNPFSTQFFVDKETSLKPAFQAKMHGYIMDTAPVHHADCTRASSSISKEFQEKPHSQLEECEEEFFDSNEEIPELKNKVKRVKTKKQRNQVIPKARKIDSRGQSSAAALTGRLQASANLWPNGPWLDPNGDLLEDFVDWKAGKFAAAFPGTFDEKRDNTITRWSNKPHLLEIDWRGFNRETQHRTAALVASERSGAVIPAAEKEALARRAKVALSNPGPLAVQRSVPDAVKDLAPDLARCLEEAHMEPDHLLPAAKFTEVSDGNMAIRYRDFTGVGQPPQEKTPLTREELLFRKQATWRNVPGLRPAIRKWVSENSDWVVLEETGPQLRRPDEDEEF